jgi:hypothetical protein
MTVRKIDIEFIGDDHENVYPKKVTVSENAWQQVNTLRKIFKAVENDANVLFGINSKINELSVKISLGTFTYSKKTGRIKDYLEVSKPLPGDLTAMANEAIGELYEKVTAPDTILLFDVDQGEPTGFGEVKDGKIHFGLE